MSRRGLFVAPFDDLADPARVGELAAVAEAAGWDGVFVWDHMGYGDRVAAIADPWICCAAIVMRTTRLLTGPMVTPLARRRPQVVARQAASLSVLSGGRFVLGVGLGDDSAGEFSDFGDEVLPRVRGEMLDEALDVVTGLLGGETMHHVGTHYRADGIRFRPAPPVPVWVAGRYGNRAPALRAASYDGFFLINVPAPGALGTLAPELTREGFDLVVDLQPGEDPQPWVDAGATWVLTRIGPYDIDVDAAMAIAADGP